MGLVQIYSLGEYIARLADRTYYVVCLCRFIARDVLYLMICLIEGRSDQVGHTCIYDGKLLGCALLDIKSLGDERTHLTHYGTAQLEV